MSTTILRPGDSPRSVRSGPEQVFPLRSAGLGTMFHSPPACLPHDAEPAPLLWPPRPPLDPNPADELQASRPWLPASPAESSQRSAVVKLHPPRLPAHERAPRRKRPSRDPRVPRVEPSSTGPGTPVPSRPCESRALPQPENVPVPPISPAPGLPKDSPLDLPPHALPQMPQELRTPGPASKSVPVPVPGSRRPNGSPRSKVVPPDEASAGPSRPVPPSSSVPQGSRRMPDARFRRSSAMLVSWRQLAAQLGRSSLPKRPERTQTRPTPACTSGQARTPDEGWAVPPLPQASIPPAPWKAPDPGVHRPLPESESRVSVRMTSGLPGLTVPESGWPGSATWTRPRLLEAGSSSLPSRTRAPGHSRSFGSWFPEWPEPRRAQ